MGILIIAVTSPCPLPRHTREYEFALLLFRSAGLLLSGFVPWRLGPGKLSRLLSCCDLSAVLSDLAIRRILHVYSWSHLREPMVITLCACEHSIKKRSNPSPMASRRRGLFFLRSMTLMTSPCGREPKDLFHHRDGGRGCFGSESL